MQQEFPLAKAWLQRMEEEVPYPYPDDYTFVGKPILVAADVYDELAKYHQQDSPFPSGEPLLFRGNPLVRMDEPLYSRMSITLDPLALAAWDDYWAYGFDIEWLDVGTLYPEDTPQPDLIVE